MTVLTPNVLPYTAMNRQGRLLQTVKDSDVVDISVTCNRLREGNNRLQRKLEAMRARKRQGKVEGMKRLIFAWKRNQLLQAKEELNERKQSKKERIHQEFIVKENIEVLSQEFDESLASVLMSIFKPQ